MNDNLSPDDILARLADVIDRADPVPDQVMEAARASYTWRTVDAELAELVYDSATEELVGVRGDAVERQMTFRSPAIEIEAVVVEGARRLIGQIVPMQSAVIVMRAGSAEQTSMADEFGRFSFENVPAGPVSLRCELGDGIAVTTEWVLL